MFDAAEHRTERGAAPVGPDASQPTTHFLPSLAEQPVISTLQFPRPAPSPASNNAPSGDPSPDSSVAMSSMNLVPLPAYDSAEGNLSISTPV
ncbi:hypothetical protein Hypma_003311 [Hypsizygus marmoreus]|uniref:Uncharacterized protein n=1 Tax=Hypsizygus marmoreus TaxID=39966 RepID=A0A369J6Y1_HYPMA|nr:hypothetical protein Hypma_003311 [Hypsizygus marmoreus]